MNSIQKVRHLSPESLLESIPEDQQFIMEKLMCLISETLPECEIKMNFNVPFYRRKKNILYLWPSAMPWGGITSGVAIGFVYGHLLQDESQWLMMGKRKQIGIRVFHQSKEVDEQADMLKSFLLESAIIDDQLAQNKKGRNRN